MTEWLSEEMTYFGDKYGNLVPAKIGIVRFGKRTKFGWQFNPDSRDDNDPDFTADLQGLSEIITALNKQRLALIDATGGL